MGQSAPKARLARVRRSKCCSPRGSTRSRQVSPRRVNNRPLRKALLNSSRLKQCGFALATLGLAAAVYYFYLAKRLPPVPQRPLRIGFEPNPPFQVRTSGGFSGLAVDVVNEAAKRGGIRLNWVETGTSSDEAFQK